MVNCSGPEDANSMLTVDEIGLEKELTPTYIYNSCLCPGVKIQTFQIIFHLHIRKHFPNSEYGTAVH